MAIPRKMHWSPPPPSPLSNESRLASPAAQAPGPLAAAPASTARQSFPVRKTPMQEKLLRKFRRQFATSAPAQPAAPLAPAAIASANAMQRTAVLGRLLQALVRDDDAGTIAACAIARHAANGQPSFEAESIGCMQGLSTWLGSPHNTSAFKTLTALMYCDDSRKRKDALGPFVALQAQAQVPMQERIFAAVERLRGQMGHAGSDARMSPDGSAAVRRLELAFLERDPALALAAYRNLAPDDPRSAQDVDRDLKDLRKLTRGLSARSNDGAPIRSLHDIVASTDSAAIRLAIAPLAIGNSPLEAAERQVGSALKKLRELSREALRLNAGASSSSSRGTKRQASGEASEPSSAAARRRTVQASSGQAPPSDTAHEDAVAMDAADKPAPRPH